MSRPSPGPDPLHSPHDPVPLNPVATDIVAEWPAGTFLENLAFDDAGESWLITSPSHQCVYRVDRSGTVEEVAAFDRPVTGIVTDRQGALVAVGAPGAAGWRLQRLTDPGPEAVCELPGVQFANGMT
jgi:hypothetical protein